jgi:hypothetical protein
VARLGQHVMRLSIVCGRRLIQGDAQVDLDRRPGDSHLLHQETYEFLTLFEIKLVDAAPYALGKCVDLAR